MKPVLAPFLTRPLQQALLALTLTAVLWAVLLWQLPAPVRALEEASADWLWRVTASAQPERRIILVDLDEASLRKLGPWPWPRARLAQLSDRLAAEGAALQVFDLVLPEAGADDARLRNSLQKNRGVLGQVFALDASMHTHVGQPGDALDWPVCPAGFSSATGYMANAPVFADVPTGHITPWLGADGVLRHQPAVICAAGKAYPALFVRALQIGLAAPQAPLAVGQDAWASAFRLGLEIPGTPGIALDSSGRVRIPWTLRPEAFVSVSAADVLAGRLPQGMLDQAWVVIGSTALGLHDRVTTPLSPVTAGFAVHAQLLQAALDGQIPAEPRNSGLWMGMAGVLGVLLLWAVSRRWPHTLLPLALATAGLSALLFMAKAGLLIRAGLWLDWLPVALFLVLFSLVLAALNLAQGRLEYNRLYAHLSSYLPSPVAKALAARDPSGAIEAARRKVIVLYADIRNFSAFAEKQPPEVTTALLHTFFMEATQIVQAQGGSLEAFQGDAVLAIWDTGHNDSAARHALSAARNLLANAEATLAAFETAASNRDLGETQVVPQCSPLALGIALECGEVTIGSIGDAGRRSHVALGGAVSRAVHIQKMTAELAHPILLGEALAQQLPAEPVQPLGVFVLEGLNRPVRIFACPPPHPPSTGAQTP